MASKTGYGASCAWRACDECCVGGMPRTSTHAPPPLPSTSGSACPDAPLLVLRAPASRLEGLPCVDSTKWSPHAIAVRSDLCYLLRTDTSSDVGTRFPRGIIGKNLTWTRLGGGASTTLGAPKASRVCWPGRDLASPWGPQAIRFRRDVGLRSSIRSILYCHIQNECNGGKVARAQIL